MFQRREQCEQSLGGRKQPAVGRGHSGVCRVRCSLAHSDPGGTLPSVGLTQGTDRRCGLHSHALAHMRTHSRMHSHTHTPVWSPGSQTLTQSLS